MPGYRLPMQELPRSVELGYKAIRYDIDKNDATGTSATLNGPFPGSPFQS